MKNIFEAKRVQSAFDNLFKNSMLQPEVREIIGDDLASLVPGSAEAARVKAALVAKGAVCGAERKR